MSNLLKLKLTRQEVKRFIVLLLFQLIGLIIASFLLEGFVLGDLRAAFATAIFIAIANAILWPTLSRLALPLTVWTFGLASLALNGIIIALVIYLVRDVQVTSFGTAILVGFILTIVNTILSTLFSIDDDAAFYRNVLKKEALRKYEPKTDKDGIIFLEIDGLAKPILEEAIKIGVVPTMERWLKSDNYKLIEWETDLSSQTGASQAGILLGNNENIPAFRWVDKKNDAKIITSSGTSDTPAIEKEHSNGKGLLAVNGAARANLFSGDAEDYIFTHSKIMNWSKFYNPAYYGFYSSPYNYMRTIVLLGWDIALEYRSRIRQKTKNVQPRLGKEKRGGIYPIVRAFTTVFLRDLTIYILIGDIFAGQKDAIYATMFGYDEIAHHSGIRDKDAFEVLKKLDRQFGRLESAAKEAKRKYHFVVLSDHGQSQGHTFKQRYGYTLEDLVKSKMSGDVVSHGYMNTDEGGMYSKLVVRDITQDPKLPVAKIKGDGKDKESKEKFPEDAESTQAKQVPLDLDIPDDGSSDESKDKKDKKEEKPEVIVLASGNLGLVYFTKWKERVTYEQLEEKYPGLIETVAKHEGVGFVLVDSKKSGPMVIGNKGTYLLDSKNVDGSDPLKAFGENAAMHIERENSFKFVPDLLINSKYWSKTDEVAAFEELIGCHGGLGGTQSRPFILFPKNLPIPKVEIIGAEHVYHVFKAWLREM